jgi:hypothetical protein
MLTGSVGLVVGIGLTWPLVLHLHTHILDDGTLDGFQFAWNLWWVGESLFGLLRHPFSTHYLYYPDGVPLLFHTGSFSLGLVSVPLQWALGVVAAENVLVITAPALTVMAIGLLAREATGDSWAGLVAGLLGTITPFMMWVLPVVYLSCGWVPPLLLWVWWRLQRDRHLGWVAVGFGLLAFSVFVSQEFAMLSMAVLGLDVLLRLAGASRFGVAPLWWRGTLVFFAAAGAFLGALAVIALANPANPPSPAHALLGSGFILGFITPRWLVPPVLKFGAVYYLGTITLLLVLVALWGRRPQRLYWLLLGVPMIAMVMGPYLHLYHPFYALPPKGETVPTSGVPGLYLIAGKLFPLLKFLRAPYRWMAAVNPVVAVLAGVGAATLRSRMTTTAGRSRLTAALVVAAAVVPTLEAFSLRAPLVSAALPPAYQVIVDDPTEAAIIELPAGFLASGWALISSQYMFYQTFHRKFLLDGTVSRLPVGARPFIGRKVQDFGKVPYVKYVVVHRDLLAVAPPGAQQQTNELTLLATQQGRLVAHDDYVDVYQLDTFRPDGVWSPRRRWPQSVPPSS